MDLKFHGASVDDPDSVNCGAVVVAKLSNHSGVVVPIPTLPKK